MTSKTAKYTLRERAVLLAMARTPEPLTVSAGALEREGHILTGRATYTLVCLRDRGLVEHIQGSDWRLTVEGRREAERLLAQEQQR